MDDATKDATRAMKVTAFIESLTADRELAAYFAGILKGLWMTGMGDEALIFVAEAFQRGDDPKLIAASCALRQLVDDEMMTIFRLFDQGSLN